MAIPASQLETWSHQGSVTQSSQTYATVKDALEAATAPYRDRNFTVFLQGSYGNDTNIYAESDVDIVIRYNGAFYSDVSSLPPEQVAAKERTFPGATYAYDDFKSHVRTALSNAFGAGVVTVGTKAIRIAANNSRRSADVIVAYEFHRYYRFTGTYDDNHVTGTSFFDSSESRIDNFPNQHCENLTTKHQATNSRFKPTVRIFKNMRSKLADDGVIGAGLAPSYYIEGLLYNVPNDKFVSDTQQSVRNVLQWLHDTNDQTNFLCANELYYLLRDGYPTSWPTANGAAFIQAAVNLWNNWRYNLTFQVSLETVAITREDLVFFSCATIVQTVCATAGCNCLRGLG
jgi:hypothetical protein